jgi:hypothetical protein
MNFKIKDEAQLRRYHKLSPADRVKVDQIINRHLAACARLDVEPEYEGPSDRFSRYRGLSHSAFRILAIFTQTIPISCPQ